MTTTKILVQKDPKNLVPMDVTSAQRTTIAQNYTIYDLNADGTKSAPYGPTVISGGTSMARTAAQLAGTPTAADIAILNGVFLLDTDPTKRYKVNPAGTGYIVDGGGGSGAVSTVAGKTGDVTLQRSDLTDDASLEAALATIPSNPLSIGATPLAAGTWDPNTNTPTIVSGVAPTDGVYARTVINASSPVTRNIDGNSTWNNNDIIEWKGTAWGREPAPPVTPNLIKGDNAGGLIAATPGLDYRGPALVQSTMALFLPPSGSTVGANGAALTLAIALDQTYPNCYMKFNANEIASGQAAGWYYVEMSSTTAGIVYNNTYTPGSGLPAIPASKTSFTTNAGGTTAGTVASTVALSATATDAMGLNGIARYSGMARWNNSAGTKKLLAYLGTTLSAWQITQGTTTIGGSGVTLFVNRNAKNSQFTYPESQTAVTTAIGTAAVDTSLATAYTLNLQTTTATDWVGVVLGKIEILPA